MNELNTHKKLLIAYKSTFALKKKINDPENWYPSSAKEIESLLKDFLKDIPISNNLKKILDLKKLSKINYISNGDDYQVLFTASKNKTRIIKKIASNCRVKLTKIGSIQSYVKKSSIIDGKNRQITLKNKGYFHKF